MEELKVKGIVLNDIDGGREPYGILVVPEELDVLKAETEIRGIIEKFHGQGKMEWNVLDLIAELSFKTVFMQAESVGI